MSSRRSFAALLALWISAGTLAAEPPADPILRIESGMHSAVISRIGTDAASRYLVTGCTSPSG
jgi:hypothetical protein